MAIQNRRGAYTDFDPQKMVPGEWAVVLSGDPNSERGKAVYMAFDVGDVERMATYEDMRENINSATSDVQEQFTEEVTEALNNVNSTATAITTSVNQFLSQRNQEFQNWGKDNNALLAEARTVLANTRAATESARTAAAQAQVIINASDAVTSWNGRAGTVTPQAGDYDATQITFMTTTNVEDVIRTALDDITVLRDDTSALKSNVSTLRTDVNTLQDDVSSLFVSENVTVTISYAAGTIGTRGAAVSCGSTNKSGYTYIGALILDHRNTNIFNVCLARNEDTQTLNVVAYRASTGAADNASVKVRKLWIKNV